uniref:Zinc finger HIT domain-containing protein n=1 Tax=Timema genevievae TaxID=629358 RepID=A0A7R9K186_TIMGE|nr:unnamed protein product [Timema genevievae]
MPTTGRSRFESRCSVVCWKSHKSGSCQESPEENITGMGSEEIAPPSYRYETEDTVPMHKLKLLEESEGLREVLKNANIRDMLVAIDNAPDPGKAIHAAMLEPIFVEFADECLKIVQPPVSGEH